MAGRLGDAALLSGSKNVTYGIGCIGFLPCWNPSNKVGAYKAVSPVKKLQRWEAVPWSTVAELRKGLGTARSVCPHLFFNVIVPTRAFPV